MEIRQNMRVVAIRPIAWVAVVLFAVLLGLEGGYALGAGSLTQSASASTPTVASTDTQRIGGPGGQFGDIEPAATSRVGGPGGQVGDAP